MESSFKTKVISVEIPPDCNIIFGQSHFIKTVEDIYETLVTSSTSLKFGVAFCEASQSRLIRFDGNDDETTKLAVEAAYHVGCGHTFFIFMKEGYPINIMRRIKDIDEVCCIFCATANPLEVIVAETKQGRGVLGVIDGEMPLGIEDDKEKEKRKQFLRTIGYKR